MQANNKETSKLRITGNPMVDGWFSPQEWVIKNVCQYHDIILTSLTFHWCYQLIGAKWRHMALEILVNTGSGNGLLPDGTKPLPVPLLTYH